ncbi:MAG: hypothetical protein ACRBN8_00325 [Nannocystales bacterium]
MTVRLASVRMLALVALVPSVGACSLWSSMTSSAAPAGSAPAPSAGEAPAPQTEFASAPSTPDPAESAPAPPKPVSVTLRNTCSETVKIFFGDKPKFGSGTYSSLSSNTSTSHSFMPGDMFWIVDDSQNGVSSFTVADGTRKIEIGSGCASLSGG